MIVITRVVLYLHTRGAHDVRCASWLAGQPTVAELIGATGRARRASETGECIRQPVSSASSKQLPANFSHQLEGILNYVYNYNNVIVCLYMIYVRSTL